MINIKKIFNNRYYIKLLYILALTIIINKIGNNIITSFLLSSLVILTIDDLSNNSNKNFNKTPRIFFINKI